MMQWRSISKIVSPKVLDRGVVGSGAFPTTTFEITWGFLNPFREWIVVGTTKLPSLNPYSQVLEIPIRHGNLEMALWGLVD